MEISGATSSTYQPSLDRTAARSRAEDVDDDDDDDVSESRDKDKVDISEEAARLAASETEDTDEVEEADKDDDDDDDGEVQEGDEKPSTAKSFAYGALGLERPEDVQNRQTDGYDFGRWLAAGITIGSIISVLV